MNYAQIYVCDTANGIGCRTTLFVSGCRHHCKGCFNPETWNFNYGNKFKKQVEDILIGETRPPYIDGITILGGEPMEPENQKEILPFLKRFKEELPDKSIWIYSGYTWEELNDPKNKRCHVGETEKILSIADILVDGEFMEEKKDITLRFRGSSNQRVIDVKRSLAGKKIVLSPWNEREPLRGGQ